jgi:hypothetical protein
VGPYRSKKLAILLAASVALGGVVAAGAQTYPRQKSIVDRANDMSTTEAVAYVSSILEQGVPVGEPVHGLYALAVGRSSLVLPMLEGKIEEVLRSPAPLDCFKDKSTNPQLAVYFLWTTIAEAGDQQALKEASKLLRIDEKRFDRVVDHTLSAAINLRNPFAVAYQGLEIGDPAVDKRILAWVEELLGDKTPSDMKRRWANAMVDRYGAAPTEADWANDPIVTRLKPPLAESLHPEVYQFALEAMAARTRK